MLKTFLAPECNFKRVLGALILAPFILFFLAFIVGFLYVLANLDIGINVMLKVIASLLGIGVGFCVLILIVALGGSLLLTSVKARPKTKVEITTFNFAMLDYTPAWYDPIVVFFTNTLSLRRLKYKIKLIYQRVHWGFDPRDLWDLDCSLAKWAIPRLQKLKETQQGCPQLPGYSVDPPDEEFARMCAEWDEILDSMIEAFTLHLNSVRGMKEVTDAEEQKKIQKGLQLFAQYYQKLGD